MVSNAWSSQTRPQRHHSSATKQWRQCPPERRIWSDTVRCRGWVWSLWCVGTSDPQRYVERNCMLLIFLLGFPGDSVVKNLLASAGNTGSIPGSEDPLEEEMETLSSILAWEIPWTEEPGRLPSMGLQSWTRWRQSSFHIDGSPTFRTHLLLNCTPLPSHFWFNFSQPRLRA